MASSTLDAVPLGSEIFVDAPIFIYHFTGTSQSCRDFLRRCENGEVRGTTSVVTLAEVTHRLMTIEAVHRGLVSPGNVVGKLRRRPMIVRELHVYREQAEKIPLMGIRIVSLDLQTLLRAGELRTEIGLLTNDSLAAATMLDLNLARVATADADFQQVEGMELYRPEDL